MAIEETKTRQVTVQELWDLYETAKEALVRKYGSLEAVNEITGKTQNELVDLMNPVLTRDDVVWALGFCAIFDMVASAASNFLGREDKLKEGLPTTILTPQSGTKWSN